jgi:hypothetical protein
VERASSLWRYVDIAKYLDLITKRQLWFPRVAELRKVDPYESAPTKYDDARLSRIVSAKTKDEFKAILSEYGHKDSVKYIETAQDHSLAYFQLLYVTNQSYLDQSAYTHSASCWHENHDESDAMWALYAGRNAGIAIKSTVSRVLDAFASSQRSMVIGKVTYDSPTSTLSALTSGIYDSLLIKRHAFHHENEVRIIARTLDGYESLEGTTGENQRYIIDYGKPVVPGVYIECDMYSLIEEVVVSPFMPVYAFDALEDITSRTLCPRPPIRRSPLFTKDDMLPPMSHELALMLEQYRRTGLTGLR